VTTSGLGLILLIGAAVVLAAISIASRDRPLGCRGVR